MKLRTALWGTALTAATLAACQVLLGIEDDPGIARLPDAPPTPPIPDSAVPDFCVHKVPPPEPPKDAESDDLPAMWFALSDFSLESDAGPLGYDLDNVCTGFTGLTLYDGGPSCSSPTPSKDFAGGVDNAFGAFVGTLSRVISLAGNATLRDQAERGERTFLIYLERYNGKDNDPYVTARLVTSERLETNLCDGGVPVDSGDGGLKPARNGCDRWQVTRLPGVISGVQPVVPSILEVGYVSNRTLVIGRNGRIELKVQLGGKALPLSDGVLVAELQPVADAGPGGGRSFRLSGTFGGRVQPEAILQTAWELGLCRTTDPAAGAATLLAVRSGTCAARDIAEVPSLDHKDAPCRYISMGGGFQADPALVGSVVDGVGLRPCEPSTISLTCDAASLPNPAPADASDGD